LAPRLDLLLIALVGTAQGTLGREPDLAQQAPHQDATQAYAELAANDLMYHRARPERELESQLQRILTRDDVIQPSQLTALKLRCRPGRFALLERVDTTFAIERQPLAGLPSDESQRRQ
jgi:hypothetical protein